MNEGAPSKFGNATKKKPEFRHSQSTKEDEAPRFQKQKTMVEIPENLNSLGIKDLKNILEGIGLKSDDCFEKNDLINRVKEY